LGLGFAFRKTLLHATRMPTRLAPRALALVLLAAPALPAGSFVTFESGPVRPLALSPSGNLLFAANTPDNRLEIFRVTAGGLERAGETIVGLEPVAVAARSDSEVYVVNHLSDSVSVVDATDPARPHVRATLLVGDEPRDVVLAGPGRGKLFITAASRGQNRPGDPRLTTPGLGRADVWVFDAANLTAAPRLLTLFCDTPRALGVNAAGTRVYAAAFHSGNRTTSLEQLAVSPDPFVNGILGDGFAAPGLPPPLTNTAGRPAPETGLIVKFDGTRWRDGAGRDFTPRVRFNLPDKDVLVIDASVDPPAVIGEVAGAGTVLFNIAVHPVTGRVYVSNLESRNHIRFEPTLRGHLAESRITIIDGATATPVHLNPHINYSQASGPPAEIALSLAFPLDLAFTSDGSTLYAAAFGSRQVAVLDAEARVTGRIVVGGGPGGLALDEPRRRLYVLNRFDQTISTVDTALAREVAVTALRYDPEPAPVRAGRPILYEAASSGHGDSACASCHVFADFDSLAWDLGDPAGAVEDNPLEPVAVQGDDPLSDFHPMKGPMTTQSLRGMAGAGAMHWRGDRNGGAGASFSEEQAFMAFRPAFEGLLGMDSEFPEADMAKFRDFILTVVYPPNPIAPLDGTLTAQQTAGKQVFDGNGSRTGLGGDGSSCASCHTLPLGADGHGSNEGLTQDFKVAHLRNLYQKVGMFGYALPSIASDSPFRLESAPTPHRGDQVRGFGFLHDGSVPTLANFFRFPLRQFTFPDQAGRTGDQKVRELEAFLLAFPTGLAPVVGQQITLDQTSTAFARDRFALLRARAGAGDCDLVLHGIVEGVQRGYVRQSSGLFQSDRQGETATEAALLASVSAGEAVLTATAVPPGSGTRIGIDRDEDGALDRDELDLGSDPADPSSLPDPERRPRFPRGDCAPGSGLNITDAVRSLDYLFRGAPAPVCLEACDSNGDLTLDISDPVHVLLFLFSGGETPGLYPACETAAGACDDSAYGCPAG
jgi:YVTN family beta-propeller protein